MSHPQHKMSFIRAERGRCPAWVAVVCCLSACDNSGGSGKPGSGGGSGVAMMTATGGGSGGGAPSTGGTATSTGGVPATGGAGATGGATVSSVGGSAGAGGMAQGGAVTRTGGAVGTGGAIVSTGGSQAATGGRAGGGTVTATGGRASGGTTATGGASSSGGIGGSSAYACDGPTTGYDVLMIKAGTTWTVTSRGTERYSGADTTAALTAAYGGLASGRTSKQSILVQGDGDIPATAQLAIPSYTVLNWCGTLNVSDTPSGSDRSPLYARGKTDIEIPNLKMTGAPQYGIFFRGTNNMILGRIDLQLTTAAGIGIRVDTSGSAGSDTSFVSNLTIDHVSGGGMGSHLVETYGVDKIEIGTVEGNGVGECGLLLNRSTNARVGLVTCTNCGTGTGYAAFRVANSVGKIAGAFPEGNIHVGKVFARGGGRGVFSVSGCGGLTIDTIDIANTGSTSILLQNTYNTTIAAVSGTVVGGLVQISNDTTNTNNGTYPPSQNVAIKNLVLSGGASVRQDWCSEFGANGCSASNVTGGTVSMCR